MTKVLMTIMVVLGVVAACLVGWKFAVCGFCIPFIYNACYWVDFPKTKWCKSPTNWAEWFSGLIIGWGLI